MLVYGDPQTTLSAAEALCRLRQLIPGTAELDSLRRMLIASGQLEQAVSDFAECHPETPLLLRGMQKITDLAATLFCNEVSGSPRQSVTLFWDAIATYQLPDVELTVKIPEGFAFYALYPEQFVLSALKWAEKQAASDGPVLVVGVRSIGTTLSAIVAAVLRSRGWHVDRCTVRPHGHPFAREATFVVNGIPERAIVVDEGPGMSGSSMVAVGEGLLAAGITRDRISFLPGHSNGPGPATSRAVHHWWRTTPSYFVSMDSLRWSGRSLPDLLLHESSVLVGKGFDRCDNLSGGEWRRWVFDNEKDWQASCAPFERLKFRCVAEDGSALLWKFEGLGGLGDGSPEVARTSSYALRPVGSCHGFVAYPWVEGTRFCRSSRAPDMIRHLVRHIGDSAGLPLSPITHHQSLDRLAEMAFCNTREVLGEASGKRAVSQLDAARNVVSLSRYGDGRLAPWEWIRTSSGEIVKVDWRGHDADHTMIGQQSLWWDVAGMLVEWHLSPAEEADALELLREQGIHVDVAALIFYRNAYCAFQMGKAFLCKNVVSENAEKERLLKDVEFYRDALCAGLS